MATTETTDNPWALHHAVDDKVDHKTDRDLDTVKRVSARAARNQFADLIGQVHYTGKPVIIERSGKPMVAVVPVELLEQHLTASSTATIKGAAEAIQTKPPAPQGHSQFGLFPELAVIEFGDDFDAIKQLWRDSIIKQLDIIQGTVHP